MRNPKALKGFDALLQTSSSVLPSVTLVNGTIQFTSWLFWLADSFFHCIILASLRTWSVVFAFSTPLYGCLSFSILFSIFLKSQLIWLQWWEAGWCRLPRQTSLQQTRTSRPPPLIAIPLMKLSDTDAHWRSGIEPHIHIGCAVMWLTCLFLRGLLSKCNSSPPAVFFLSLRCLVLPLEAAITLGFFFSLHH